MNVVELRTWWEHCVTHAERDELMSTLGDPLNPDLALALWRGCGGLHVVEPEEWPTDTDPGGWTLTALVAAFVGEREHDRHEHHHAPSDT